MLEFLRAHRYAVEASRPESGVQAAVDFRSDPPRIVELTAPDLEPEAPVTP